MPLIFLIWFLKFKFQIFCLLCNSLESLWLSHLFFANFILNDLFHQVFNLLVFKSVTFFIWDLHYRSCLSSKIWSTKMTFTFMLIDFFVKFFILKSNKWKRSFLTGFCLHLFLQSCLKLTLRFFKLNSETFVLRLQIWLCALQI